MCIRIETNNLSNVIATLIPTKGVKGFSKEMIENLKPALVVHSNGQWHIEIEEEDGGKYYQTDLFINSENKWDGVARGEFYPWIEVIVDSGARQVSEVEKTISLDELPEFVKYYKEWEEEDPSQMFTISWRREGQDVCFKEISYSDLGL